MNRFDGPVVLSAAGEARREAIRRELYAAMGARKRRRWVVRVGAGIAPVFAAAVLLASGGRIGAGGGRVETGSGRGVAVASGLRHMAFEEVATRVGLADELAVTRRAASIAVVDDDELIDALREAGHPTGLIRTQGRVTLTAHVASNVSRGDGEPAGETPEAPGGDAEHG